MTVPRVSICVPTFRGAPWLAECLESALAQTMEDLEVVVVDDASDDGTADVAREFAARDDRVRVEQNETRLGLAANWNRCFQLAKGTWFKFLFQDDVLARSCLAKMTDVPECQLVVCDRRVDMAEGTPARVRDYFAGLPGMDDLFGEGVEVEAEQVCTALAAHPGVNFFGEPSAVLMHRDVLGFRGFNPNMIQLCDLEFAARIGSNHGLIRVREELATFRVHEGSTSATNREAAAFRKDVLDTLILLHEYAFHADFAKLREVARQADPSVSFSVLAARELQRAQRDCGESDDPKMRAALDEVLAAYPNLARPLWQLWHRVRKQVRRS